MLFAGKIATYIVATTLMSSPEPLSVHINEFECMVEAVHFEARGESRDGKKAVANVILNRVDLPYFPDTICGVVHQKMQFSYRNKTKTPPVKMKNPLDVKSFKETVDIALKAVQNKLKDNTKGADHYFAQEVVLPNWADDGKITKTIDGHTFVKIY